MYVQVRHLKACDDETGARSTPSPLDPLPDSLGYLEATRQQSPVGIRPPVDLTPRHDKSVTRPQRSNAKKRDNFRILPDETPGQLTSDNA